MLFKTENISIAERLNKFGGSVLGHRFGATDKYLTKDGKPYICRMGEFHFSRFPEECWEEELIKMKQGGIDVVASYVFWIHHEQTEGKFCFDGNKNIGRFLKTCKKLGLPFVMRIGPWVHGEARNGGFPDWIDEMCKGKTRTDAQPYLTYVKRYFEKIYEQVKDDLDGILGIQIENELRKQREYVIKLKKILTNVGFSPAYWTFTGWGGSDVPESCPMDEVLFLYGGYPEAPWNEDIEPFYGSRNFLFSKERDDGNIGADLFGRDETGTAMKKVETATDTPFLTCELGGGNQVTYHRRPTIIAEDVLALAVCKLGSGTNGLGYYVYHGGINPVGKTTTQESRDTGYPNDLPMISYDFQAPLGEAGQIRKSYYYLQKIHRFVDFCGAELAPMTAVFPDKIPGDFLDEDILRCAVRSDGERGFLFVSNHYHGGEMKQLSETVRICLTNGSEIEIPVNIQPHAVGIIPFGYKIGTKEICWISALPQREDDASVYFVKMPGIAAEICIDGEKVEPVKNGMIIGGKKIVLEEIENPIRTVGEMITLSQKSQSEDKSFFGHIINFDGTIPEFTPVDEYKFAIPENAKYLKIEAIGNIGALYLGEKLISDYYLFDGKWVVDVRRLPEKSELTLKILPLTEKDKSKIFMEFDMPTGSVEPKVRAISEDVVHI